MLPYAIAVTEFFTFYRQPFSKSKGIGINAIDALKIAPADYWRYFLLINRPETKDFDITWDSFIETINHDLNDTIGNFIYRTLFFIYNYFNGQVPSCGQLDNDDQALLSSIEVTAQRQAQYFDDLKIKDALVIVRCLAQAGNACPSTHEPWTKLNEDESVASTKYYEATQVARARENHHKNTIPIRSRHDDWRGDVSQRKRRSERGRRGKEVGLGLPSLLSAFLF